MDYCEGESLDAVLVREGTLAPDRLVKMLVPLLGALEALHEASVTHRDIKPGNIYLREDCSPVLLDFGAARQVLAQHSRSVTAMATPGYAAFEQYSTKGKQGPWTDIYGLGATLYRCVTGGRPPDASDRMLEDELVPASGAAAGHYPDRLLRQIDGGLRLRSEDRPQSLAEWLRFGVEAGVQETRGPVASSPYEAADKGRSLGSSNPDELIAARYRVLGEHGEIVEDTMTGLKWHRCCLGQTWDGRTCVGEAHRYTWDEARQAADVVPGWRLPAIRELRTLTYCSSGQPDHFNDGRACNGDYKTPTIEPEAFPNSPVGYVWSDSPGAFGPDFASIVDFDAGAVVSYVKGGFGRVRLVRGGQ